MEQIKSNWKSLCIQENFIGIGSTRKVYRIENYVIKVHIHSMGYKQSKREFEIYNQLKETGFAELLAPVHYVDEEICIQSYYPEVPMHNNQSFEIDERQDFWNFPENYQATIKLLDEEFDAFDLKDSSNYGVDPNHSLVLIDYGMSKTMYENEWVPAAESGEVPQIDFLTCKDCGNEKEIRIYGEEDQDIRCISCGKV